MTHTIYFDLLDAFDEEGCPVCRLALSGIQRYLEGVNYEGVNDSEFRAAYAKSVELCLPHLQRTLAPAPEEQAFNTLRDIAIKDENRLHRQLREIIRKHDDRSRHEPTGEEVDAAARAVSHVDAASGITR